MRKLFCGIGALVLLLCCGPALTAEPGPAKPPISAEFLYGDNLRLEFAQPMQTWANEIRRDVVTLSPALPSHCAWSSDTVLGCGYDKERRPAVATRYRIALAAGLKTQTGEVLPARVLFVETERPTLQAGIDGWAQGFPKIIVSTSDKVTAPGVAAVLRLRLDGKLIGLPPLRALPPRGGWERERRFALQLGAVSGIDRHLVLSVVPGLKTSAGPLPGKQNERLISALVNEPFRVRGVACAGRKTSMSAGPVRGVVAIDCTPGESVQVVFSRHLDSASRAAFASSLPHFVKLREWPSGGDWAWRHSDDTIARAPPSLAEMEVDAADATTVIPLSDALRAEDGDPLQPVSLRIRTGDYRPALRTQHAAALIADGNHPPIAAEAVNAGATKILVQAIGARARDEVLQVSPGTPRNLPVILTSVASAHALAEGGWTRWTPQVAKAPAQSYARSPAAVQFAAPGFDLFAVASRRQVLVWANTWGGDQAVGGADVELLWMEKAGLEPRVLARATTGVDGVADLFLPSDFVVPASEGAAEYPMWLVRAVSGTRRPSTRAVLPVGVTQHYGLGLGRASDTKLWGVADRPLYRAGDIVKYRLWQREERDGRLMHVAKPQPLTLKLYDSDEGKTIQEWEATPTADGAIVGEVALPVHLTDANYCIGMGEAYSVQGTCFFVGTYRAQDLWAEAKTPDRVLRDGDTFAVDLTAGYYSGGPAAGVGIAHVTTMLTGLPLQEAYPQFAGYTFVDVTSEDASAGIALAGERALKLVTDAQGRARAELPVRGESHDPEHLVTMPAFGRLQAVVEVKLAERESTASNAAKARYTRFERFVGLRLQPRWFDATTPVQVDGIVIDADGHPIANAAIDVEVHYLPGFDSEKTDAAAKLLTRCHVVVNTPTVCNFPRKQSGRYRLTARSGDAAPAAITSYLWVDGQDVHDAPQHTVLELLEAPAQVGAPVRVLLKQPSASARVLFVFGSGDSVLGHRVESVVGTARDYALPIAPEWRRHITVTAYVRGSGAAVEKAGYRVPVEVTSDNLQVSLPDNLQKQAPLAISFDVHEAKPGDTVRLTLRNASKLPRDVTVSVMDDALRALAADYLPYSDPHGEFWLGARAGYNDGQFAEASFGHWNQAEGHIVLPWPDPDHAGRLPSTANTCTQSDEAAAAACNAAEAAQAAADAAAGVVGEDRVRRVDSEQAAPVAVFDNPSELRSLPPPPPMAEAGAASLDRIEVTGSRIRRVDAFNAGAEHTLGLRPRADMRAPETGHILSALTRVRTEFADTALWLPDIHLAPGESRSVPIKLPDNLTRWRAVAWSSDADDDFDMAEATLETGLPVEVRLQTPVRIYPGDRARLAANVRQVGDAAVQVQTQLQVEGIGGPIDHTQPVPLPARGQGSFALEIAPHQTGTLRATARAEAPAGRDAVAAPVEVASSMIAARKVQAGWLGREPLTLDVPGLPVGASDAQVQVTLLRGGAGLLQRWTEDLRDYSHRCWEQILSRAVAAALAIERGDVANWPQAPAVVKEAVDNAAVFQGENGDFRYFAEMPTSRDSDPPPQVALTAYTVRALALLRALGHPVAPRIEEHARAFLESHDDVPSKADADAVNNAAFAASSSAKVSRKDGDDIWKSWEKLSPPGQIAATRALAISGHAASRDAMQRVLVAAPARGAVRVLRLAERYDRWMSSEMREQCALIDLLHDYPLLADSDVRPALIAGLTDLYAGGITAVDTQTGAYCLMALRDAHSTSSAESLSATVHLGNSETELRLPAGQDRAEWQTPLATARQLRIEPGPPGAVPSSYVAELRYQEDARQARASAVGFSIERRYEVLRAGHWAPVAGKPVREGDWLRITLVMQTSAPRYFVAVTDAVPGGLRPTDLTLSSVAGLDLEKVSDRGSAWFGTRRLDPRTPRFYAEFLPAGKYEVHYFAHAGNAGDYLAAPASMELMYGNASSARTAASRLQILRSASSHE